MPPAKKRSRSGPRFFHGDDLTKTREDRKRTSSSEPWEKKRNASSKRAPSKAVKKAGARGAKKTAGATKKASTKKRASTSKAATKRPTAAKKSTKRSNPSTASSSKRGTGARRATKKTSARRAR